MTSDLDLLRDYVHHQSQSAFGELVRRHADWVHAIARRKVRDDQIAQDVSQATFIVLSRKAPQLLARRWNVKLTGWLYHVVRLTSANALRELSRRRRHERAAATQRAEALPAERAINWDEVLPLVDTSLAGLRALDREAVLLRFYRQQSFTDVAHTLGISEEAARKRVTRAIDRLRVLMRRRGHTSLASAALASALWAGAAPAAGVTIATRAAEASAGSSLLAKSVLTALTWKQASVGALAVTLVVLAGSGAAVLLQLRAAHPQPAQAAVVPAPMPAAAPMIDPVAQQRMTDVHRTFAALRSASWQMDYQQPADPPHFWGPWRKATVAFRRPNLCVVHSSDGRGEFWAMSDGREMAWLKTAFRSEPGHGGWTVPDPTATSYYRMPASPGDDTIKRVMEDGQGDGFDVFRWMCAGVEAIELESANFATLISLAQGPEDQIDGVATESVVATYTRRLPDPRHAGQFVITYEMGRDDHFIRRITQTWARADGLEPPRTRIATYTRVRINTDLPDEMFALAPPAGLKPQIPQYGYDTRRVSVGAPPPPFETVDVSGKPVSLSDYHGQVLMLKFVSPVSELLAPRDGPRAAPDVKRLLDLHQKYHDKGLKILTIGSNRRGEKGYREPELAQAAASLEIPWRVVYDAGRLIADSYGIERGITMMIGRDGNVSMLDDDTLLEVRLRKALAKPATRPAE
jgi:RNA polymerase sigma factor (sigma-70 family)